MNKIKLIICLALLIVSSIVIIVKPTKLGLDLQGGIHLLLEASPTKKQPLTKDAMLGSLEVIRNRIDALGLTEPSIRLKGTNQISVELPGIKNPDEAKSMIGDTALLEFFTAEWAPPGIENLSADKQKILIGNKGVLSTVIDKDINGKVVSERPIILIDIGLTGADLIDASPGTDQYGKPLVNLEFSTEGGKKFYNITSQHINKPLAILLDKTVISAPNIREPIAGGKAQITGDYSVGEVKNLVIKLKAGALPIPVDIISEKLIGPTLGKDSIEKSKLAFIIGFILICLYMSLYYKKPGILAAASLIFYVTLSFSLFKLLNATLTLPGIAGFILTIGMAVDANVIIFERIKEELLNEKTLQTKAILNGFKKAYLTILDANITTLIAAAVLFWLGSGTIKGFAVALTIGILVSMFSAITVTQTLLISLKSKKLFVKKAST